jgi:hypothetical protein
MLHLSNVRRSNRLQTGGSLIWRAIRMVLQSATKWEARFRPKQMPD